MGVLCNVRVVVSSAVSSDMSVEPEYVGFVMTAECRYVYDVSCGCVTAACDVEGDRAGAVCVADVLGCSSADCDGDGWAVTVVGEASAWVCLRGRRLTLVICA